MKKRNLGKRKKMKIRCAKQSKKDAEKMLKWRSNEEARKTALTENIEWDEHWEWYKKSIKDSDNFLYFGVLKKEEIGVVRFERKSKNLFLISVFLSTKHRGKGIGPELIRMGCEKIFNETDCKKIIAEIKTDNVISIRAFEKAFFTNKKIVKKKL